MNSFFGCPYHLFMDHSLCPMERKFSQHRILSTRGPLEAPPRTLSLPSLDGLSRQKNIQKRKQDQLKKLSLGKRAAPSKKNVKVPPPTKVVGIQESFEQILGKRSNSEDKKEDEPPLHFDQCPPVKKTMDLMSNPLFQQPTVLYSHLFFSSPGDAEVAKPCLQQQWLSLDLRSKLLLSNAFRFFPDQVFKNFEFSRLVDVQNFLRWIHAPPRKPVVLSRPSSHGTSALARCLLESIGRFPNYHVIYPHLWNRHFVSNLEDFRAGSLLSSSDTFPVILEGFHTITEPKSRRFFLDVLLKCSQKRHVILTCDSFHDQPDLYRLNQEQKLTVLKMESTENDIVAPFLLQKWNSVQSAESPVVLRFNLFAVNIIVKKMNGNLCHAQHLWEIMKYWFHCCYHPVQEPRPVVVSCEEKIVRSFLSLCISSHVSSVKGLKKAITLNQINSQELWGRTLHLPSITIRVLLGHYALSRIPNRGRYRLLRVPILRSLLHSSMSSSFLRKSVLSGEDRVLFSKTNVKEKTREGIDASLMWWVQDFLFFLTKESGASSLFSLSKRQISIRDQELNLKASREFSCFSLGRTQSIPTNAIIPPFPFEPVRQAERSFCVSLSEKSHSLFDSVGSLSQRITVDCGFVENVLESSNNSPLQNILNNMKLMSFSK